MVREKQPKEYNLMEFKVYMLDSIILRLAKNNIRKIESSWSQY